MMVFPQDSYLTKEIIENYSESGLWHNIGLFQLLVKAAQDNPKGVAVISYKEEKRSTFQLTYEELLEKVNLVANGLLRLGVQKGDVVSVQLPNWWEFVVLSFATFKLGAVINSLTPIYRQKEVSFIMKLTESKVVVVPEIFRDFNYLEMMRELRPSLPSLEKIIVVSESNISYEDSDVISFDMIIKGNFKKEGDTYKDIKVDPNSLVQLGFTSGTTGEPKGVMHTHNTLEATVRNYVEHMKFERKTMRNLVVSPVGHQTGFLWGTIMTVFLNGTMIYLDIWNKEKALKIMQKEKITHMIAAYPFLHDIAMIENIEKKRPSSLKFICIPGAPIPRHMVRVCSDKLDCIVSPAWGMTEYGIALAVSPLHPPSAYKTDGGVVNGASVRVVDKNGKELPAGEEGDLQIKGAGLFVGYYKRKEKTLESFKDGVWFETGDRAVKDEKGFVSITGRTKDIIIRGGENIPVAEIENLLFKWDKVDDVAIVAMPDDRLGERACAYIVPNDDNIEFQEMIDYLMAHGIAKQKLPERLEIIKELPRTASGKVQKYILRNDIKKKLADDLNFSETRATKEG